MATATKKHGERKHQQRDPCPLDRLNGAHLYVDWATSSGDGRWSLFLSDPKHDGKDCVGDCKWHSWVANGPNLNGRFRYDAMNKLLRVRVNDGQNYKIFIHLIHFNGHAERGRGLWQNTAGDNNAYVGGVQWKVERWGSHC